MEDIDKEWEHFMSSSSSDDINNSDDENEFVEIIQQTAEEFISANLSADLNSDAPKASSIYISTKTKIAYLNMPIDLRTIFWKVPVIPYSTPKIGIIKNK